MGEKGDDKGSVKWFVSLEIRNETRQSIRLSEAGTVTHLSLAPRACMMSGLRRVGVGVPLPCSLGEVWERHRRRCEQARQAGGAEKAKQEHLL